LFRGRAARYASPMSSERGDWREEPFLDEEEALRALRPQAARGARLLVGTSGWSYKDWEGVFYPVGAPAADYLAHYGRVFRTVEIDATFYALPRASVVENWALRSPPGFIFSAKFPREITHEAGGLERDELAQAFIERMGLLGEKRGPLLLQFPPRFEPERLPALARFLEVLPASARYAVEFRHPGWHSEELLALLAERQVAWAAGVGPLNPPQRPVTTDFVYLRWIGDRNLSVFDRVRIERGEEIRRWAEWIESVRERLHEVYGYFNNHYAGHGPASARELLAALGEPAPPAPPPAAPPKAPRGQGELFA